MSTRHSQHGVSLIELIMFIVIVSVAVAGILLVMNVTTKSSADPLIHKQSLAIAESLLEEIELMPFTYCDPDDANAASAASAVVGAGGCAATVEALGAETIAGVTEDRYGTAAPAVNASFDNVNDYSGFSMAAGAIMDINNANIGLNGYAASVTMTQPGLGAITGEETLLINVTVTGPDNVPVTLEGYRTRYAPRDVP